MLVDDCVLPSTAARAGDFIFLLQSADECWSAWISRRNL